MITLPDEYVVVLITYVGIVHVPDKYYGRNVKQEVTRKAFYSKSDGYYNNRNEWVLTPNGYFNVPQFWKSHTWNDGSSSLMPHTFYNYGRVLPENVINWRLHESNTRTN